MRGITGTVVRLLCMSVVIAASHIDVRAQNTILVGDLHSVDSTFVWDTTVFATRLPSFALGHQWGAADLDKLNTALQMNVTADQFGFLNPTTHIRQLKHLGRGNNDTNYLVWTSPLANLSDSNMAFLGYWMGMRWEPAENGGYARTWKPRDADSWPLSFTARHFGSVSSVTSDVNYRRYRLDVDTALTYPIKVLDSAEPRNRLYCTTLINWNHPLETQFPKRFVISGSDTTAFDDIDRTMSDS